MGEVYRVFDRAQQREVALKTLKATGARDLYRFKREFRTLADLAHPSLCTLHELHTSGDEWFFTMEMVRGVSLIDWVRPSQDSDRPFLDGDDDTAPRPRGPRSRSEILAAPVDLDRLERAIGPLCDGVYALHAAGKLHRDLKPSNVMVEPTGRVVLVDFGLTADVDQLVVDRTHERAAVGTPAYMSPEQAADLPLTAASDWYAVGVMIYEALTGRRPFEGRADEVMRRKQSDHPPRPQQLAPETPAYLDELCMALLSADPTARPDGPAVLDALGREPSMATATVERTSGVLAFVGRDAQLGVLQRALLDSRRAGVAVLVRGASGMGKSALVTHFLAGVGDALVLSGRCYERENVPYKTLDTLIDALTTALLALSPGDLAPVLPREVGALARLFPVLRRVPQIAEPAVRSFQPADPQELRVRAWSALRAILARLASMRPLVLCVDDLQWGDLDSATFLGDLIARPDRPPMLVVLVHRSEDIESPLVLEVQKRAASSPVPVDVRTLDLPPLGLDEARDLVRTLSGTEEDDTDWAGSLVRDAGGNTLFLAELARSAGTAGGATTLDELLRTRIARLPDHARALLEACAVAGRPMANEVAARAAGLVDPSGALAVLRAERMVRAGQGDSDRLEPFHDRVRAAVVDELDTGELVAVHRGLADGYLAAVPVAHEALVDHLLGAGVGTRAAEHAVWAAAAAEDALAFRRAADLYAIALEYGDHAADRRRRLLRARAVALVNAGQLLEAATVYQQAQAAGAPPDEHFELERLRVEQLLRAGQLRVGLAHAQELLAAIGYRMPQSRRGQLIKLLGQRAALRLRGLGFTERAEDTLPIEEVRTVDVLWSIASGLSFADPIGGKLVQHWHLRRALALGEPRRLAAALSIEIGYLLSTGNQAAARAARLMVRARAVAETHGDPFHRGLVEASCGFGHFLIGQWQVAREQIEAGLRLMRDHGVNARWEIDIVECFHMASLVMLGELRELAQQTPRLLNEAEDRGDVYAQHGLRSWRSNLAWLVMGRPEDARAHLIGVANERGDQGAFQLHDYYQLVSSGNIDLYLGDGAGAVARLTSAWPQLEASMLLRVQSVAIEANFLHARAALAAAHASSSRSGKPAHLATARQCATRLEREQVAWSQALATLVRAGIAHADGDVVAAVPGYAAAEAQLAAAQMALHERSARMARAELIGGGEGAALAAAVAAWMREQTVADPAALSRVFAPR